MLCVLQDAVRGDHGEVVSLLIKHGGQVGGLHAEAASVGRLGLTAAAALVSIQFVVPGATQSATDAGDTTADWP
jgi:hypothetical protein